jgi:hypothetical protein
LDAIQFLVENTSAIDLNTLFDNTWFPPFCA